MISLSLGSSMKLIVRAGVRLLFLLSSILSKTKFNMITANFARNVRDGFGDYITDTHLRRGYIEALRLLQSYKQPQNPKPQQSNPPNQTISIRSSSQPELISLTSRYESSQKQQPLQKKQSFQKKQAISLGQKKLRNTFELKRQQLLMKKIKSQELIFQNNQIVLISAIVYVIGFLNNQIQIKKSRNLKEFLEEFQNKTSLSESFLENIIVYLKKIHCNTPTEVYQKLQQTYLYSLCKFIHKVVKYKKIFANHYDQLFEVTKTDKLASDRKQESSSWLALNCKENNKIFHIFLKHKALNCYILQNLAAPQVYWNHIFKKKNITPSGSSTRYGHLYGLHISKTSSNENINFGQRSSKGDIETIKNKSCGVLLHDLSKFVPDGIVVYFYSSEGLENFVKQLDRDDEKILKRIQNNKKIYYESVYEEENYVNFQKFKKCCEIGRGAIFIMTANGKAAQYLKFPRHLSRCLLFLGLPRRQHQRPIHQIPHQILSHQPPQQKQLQLHQHQILQKINIINQCINNCLSSANDYKSIIFVGAEITNDLQIWYESFIKSWDETTRESLMKLRAFFQKMDKPYKNGPTSSN